MAVVASIIHCQVDQEPRTFHDSDMAGDTLSFAVNLSFGCLADIHGSLEADEVEAADRTLAFLEKARSATFAVYAKSGVDDGPFTLTKLADELDGVRDTDGADGADLHDWLGKQKTAAEQLDGVASSRFWAPLHASGDAGASVSIEAAGAGPRVRAVQAWDAPIGHRFGLTCIVRIPVGLVQRADLVVVPYFDGAAPQETIDATLAPDGDTLAGMPANERRVSFDYEPYGGGATLTGRSCVIPKDSASKDCEALDPGLTSDGFLIVNPEADQVRRIARWFEERAASLMAANVALGPKDAADAQALEPIFGVATEGTSVLWDGAVWYLVSRLLAALDPLTLAILKPGSPESEGEVLAPLVTRILGAMTAGAYPALDPAKARPPAVLDAIRTAFRGRSPLGRPDDSVARVALALERLFNIGPPRMLGGAPAPIAGDSDLVSELLWWWSGKKDDATAPYVPPRPNRPLTQTHHTDYIAKVRTTLAAQVTRAATALEQGLQGEAGAERAILRVLETVETPVQDTATHAWVGQIFPTLVGQAYAASVAGGDGAVAAQAAAAVATAWADYRALLDGPFNGAEAVRRAAGACLARAALADAGQDRVVFPAADVADAIGDADAFADRFFPLAGGAPRELLAVHRDLARVDPAWLAKRADLEVRLHEIYARTVGAPARELLKPTRFIPDSHPHPLTVQIGANIDGAHLDAFMSNFNGFGVAVRRLDGGKDRWAHAHLADFAWTPAGLTRSSDMVRGGLHAMRPAISDGRGPMFIEYEGFPFADSVSKARRPDKSSAPPDDRAAFYTPVPHEPGSRNPFEPTPRLAYGRSFETFSFVMSNAGTLPAKLRDGGGALPPWMPVSEPDAPGETVVSRVCYRRRTAVADMSLGEIKDASLGRAIDGVTPLAADYPRGWILAAGGVDGVGDLFRERDGLGGIQVPDGSAAGPVVAEWSIDEMRWSGDPNELTLQLIDEPDRPGKARFEVKLDVNGRPARLAFALRTETHGSASRLVLDITIGSETQAPIPIRTELGRYCWVRLRLAPKAGKSAALSYAGQGGDAKNAAAGPLVLLAPDDPGVWRKGLATRKTLCVSTPRVSFLDFERWFANVDNDIGSEILHDALLHAYLMRHLDKELGHLVDRLPDPAVEAIRFEFATIDDLSGAPPAGIARTMSVRRALAGFEADQKLKKQAWTPDILLEKVLRPLDRAFRFPIELGTAVAAGLDVPATLATGATVRARTAPGSVTALSMSALVPKAHFEPSGPHPSVYDRNLLQYALREVDRDCVAFPSAALRVEAMFDGIRPGLFDRPHAIALADEMIAARPVPRARSYDLVSAGTAPADPAQARRWRLIAEVDVATQLWRPTGRPIYSWIAPRSFAASRTGTVDAALPIRFDEDGEVARFEREAFFDRQHVDARTITQPLSPFPAATVLENHAWDAPSATYFRHRFRLRSRYAGSLARAQGGEVAAWKEPSQVDPTDPADWTQRVALLADVLRIPLTRPQLRALIPLTTAPGRAGESRPAPPVAAVLQEPPFARGGLADRVVSEIKTGFGYGFARASSPRVAIQDARKEIGPTPRLTYEAMARSAAQAMTLVGEGPMGLTFDNVNASAPAFPNTMISLRPVALRDDVDPPLEDVFLGVAMRRYAHPDWAIRLAAEPEPVPLDPERTWWIELTIPASGSRSCMRLGGTGTPILTLRTPGSQIEARVSVAAIDRQSDPPPKSGSHTTAAPKRDGHRSVVVARAERGRLGGLVLLHHPLAPGLYSTSILVWPQAVDVAEGLSTAPVTLASFEWSVPDAEKTQAPGGLTFDDKLKPRPSETAASASTFLRWTRTSRDFDVAHVVAIEDDGWADATVPIHDLQAVLTSDHSALSVRRAGQSEPVWLCGSTFKSRFPLHVHRHIGMITTRYLPELGRPVEVFCRSAGPGGVQPPLLAQDGSASPQAEKAVRIVEFETPAAILCDGTAPVPDRFKLAYFDLVSTGYESGAARLFVRFVGRPAQLKTLQTLDMRLWPAGKDVKPTDFPPWAIPLSATGSVFSTGLQVTLRPGAVTLFDLLRSDGGRKRLTVPAPGKAYGIEPATEHAPGFFLSVQARSSGGMEFWTDVSILHSRRTDDPAPFDFDWLFSPGGAANEAESVGAAGLNQMVEAQARIVMLSQAIPIVSS